MDRRLAFVALPAASLASALLLAGTPSAGAAAAHVVAEGTFSTTGPAWTYDAVVPAGASAVVRTVETGSGSTMATLRVRGFAEAREFQVHAHTGSCGALPTASAGHYQHVVGGPVDDANELWLSFSTTPSGNGSAQSVVEWQVRDGEARSLTFHDPSRGGMRVACLPVGF
jgi:Cu-Zn family superoxide dismutase